MNIHDAMVARYQAPEWALFFEVANGPGSTLRRYADAMAMSLFPSRGLDLHGFEIKKHRGDWLSEKRNPKKAEEIAAYCDFWWLVIGDKKVALVEELPANWGLLVIQGSRLRQVKKATRLKPAPLNRKLVASLLRRAHEQLQAEIELFKESDAIHDAREKGQEEGAARVKAAMDRAQGKYDRLEGSLKEFEKRSGLRIREWDGAYLGDAVKSLQEVGPLGYLEKLSETASHIERTARILRGHAMGLRKHQDECQKKKAKDA